MKFGLAASTLIATLASTAHAFSTGAGGCAGGVPAVAGLHIRDDQTTGSLADGGVTISVGGTELAAGATVDATAMEEVTITATATGSPFKGILVRLESGATDMSGVLTSSSALLSDAAACSAPVAGITHTSSEPKTSADVTMLADAAMEVSMDVTVVMDNSATSEYYHSTFTLNVAAGMDGEMDGDEEMMDGDEEMMDEEMDPPTDAPVAPPTDSAAPSAMLMGVSALAVAAASFLLM